MPEPPLEGRAALGHNRIVALSTFIGIFVFLFGLIIGSFLNVCILRIPAGKSIVMPASACPKCGAPIRAYDNIPVLSWLLLGGKCRGCKTEISWMYPVVELLTGLIFSLFTKPMDGTALWIANHLFEYPPPAPVLSLVDALLGAAVGSGLLWLVSEAYFKLRGREGMGLGDVKMMLMAGAFLGAKRTLLTILAGSLLGSVLGVAIILARRKDADYELPFGTFLGAGALLVVFFGTPLVNWYQSLLMVR